MSQPQAVVGVPKSRVDGRSKVTGEAKYAADNNPAGVVHAVVVDSSVGLGRITGVDTKAALAQRGVLAVLSHLNTPRLPGGSGGAPLQDGRVRFFGQPVAVVVATTLEAARHAARLVHVSYAAKRPVTVMKGAPADEPETYKRGDAQRALASADVRMSLTYRMARNHHNAMEPHGIVARWEGNKLTVWDKTQGVLDTRSSLAEAFRVPENSVRVVAPYLGGAFGSGLRLWPYSVIAATAARVVKRPVKLVLTREQLYYGVGFRPAYEYTLRVGSDRRGRVIAMTHDVTAESSRTEQHVESVLVPGQMLYGTPHVHQIYRTVPLDVNPPTWMRGPGYSSGAFPLESAMDELAHEVGLDPIELRRRNETATDRSTGLPFSTRRLRECYDTGARRFGWHRRNPTPGSTRDGDWLIGYGMASGVYDTARVEAEASVRLNADGSALIQSATGDMGPGTATSMSQIAADALGLTMGKVTFRLGDSRLPEAPSQSGSQTMASVGSAVQNGCDKVRRSAIQLAVGDTRSPLHGADAADIVVRNGTLYLRTHPARRETYQQLLARNRRTHLDALGSYTPSEEERFSLYAFAATFAEVAVDVRLGLVRIRRMLGVYDVGRVINPKLADSQALGAMVGGMGAALLERTDTDHRDGRIVNASLADYLVPVNADIPDLSAVFLDGSDRVADPIGVKGLGEVVIVGVAPAIANAVFNATGRRIRELPITADALLGS